MPKIKVDGDEFSFEMELNGRQIIGRPTSSFEPDISIPSKLVSRMHGEFITNEDGCYYRDMGSSNGTFLNGKKLEEKKYCPFQEGDVLSIHKILIQYCSEQEPVSDICRDMPQSVSNQKVIDGKTQVPEAAPFGTLFIDIEERSVTSHFKKFTLLKDIHVQIPNHSMVLILGGSGAGKTTFMNAVMGYEPAKGQILYNKIDIYRDYEKMKHQIGYVPQQDLLRMNDTVYDTIFGAAQMRLPAGLSESELQSRVMMTMNMLGLEREKNSLVGKLSGGQRKRLSIAVEYIANPALFFLDEPDSGLDGIMARELMENLRKIADDGRIVMVISHSPDRAFELFDQVIVLAKDSRDNCGHLVFSGSPKEACSFFGVENLEGVVKKINRPDEGGEGKAEFYISKYAGAER